MMHYSLSTKIPDVTCTTHSFQLPHTIEKLKQRPRRDAHVKSKWAKIHTFTHSKIISPIY